MMHIINGLLNYSRHWELPHVLLFTGNSTITKRGAVVMGRGAAKQVRDTYPKIDVHIAEEIQKKPNPHLVWVNVHPTSFIPTDQWLGWFKVKNHWAEPAKIELITQSTQELKKFAELHSEMTFHMNYPGVGNGKLVEIQVSPIIQQLPDNVLIYR